jgi:predicted naringenin-chalcone synthase
MNEFTILGQGTAVPPYTIDRQESVQIVVDNFCPTEKEERIVPILYRMAGVQQRHSVLLGEPTEETDENSWSLKLMHTPKSVDDMGPTVGQRMEIYEQQAYVLACQAAEEALENSGVSPSDITHLVTVSCSGFVAPGVDIKLMKSLGLPATVERAHVGFMGCQGALNGLRVAEGFSRGRPKATVLLCAVELCSIHYHYGWNPEHIVANALFADGAAALVGALREDEDWRIKASGACLVPDSEDAMTWRIRDNGFLMSLSNKVPSLIETHLRDWLEGWLADNRFKLEDIATWAVHPGGPRILSSVQKSLELPKEALEVSRNTLKNYGNMSSPTILFILKQLREQSAPTPCVAMAFGPGLMVETVLFC